MIEKNKAYFKDLSFVALFSLIVGSMMGSGVFDIPENTAHGAGVVAVCIGWVITIIGILSLSSAFIYITSRRPDIKSGIYGYAKHGFGDYVGFNSAWGYALNALLANASYLIYICATMGNFALFKFLGSGNTQAALILESCLIWGVYFLVSFGIREASIINTLITFVKIIVLAVIIIVFIVGFNFAKFKANVHANLQFEPLLGSLLEQVKSTMLVTVWAFTGIEAACIFALHAKHMGDVVKATLLAAIVVSLILSVISILPFGLLSAEEIRQLPPPSTAGLLAIQYGVNSGNLVRVAVIISVLGALLVWTMISSNMFYLASVDATMPKAFMRMNKHNVPITALLVSSIAAQLFIVVAYFTNAVYLAMIQFATSLVLLPYLLSALFAMKLIILERKVDVLSWVKGILAVFYSIWLVYSGGVKFLALSSLMYLIGSIFYFMARREHGKTLFDNKLEVLLFWVFVVLTLASYFVWKYQ